MTHDNGGLDERILILAPHGRDAEVIHQVLARNGFGGGAVANFDAMVAELQLRSEERRVGKECPV